MTKAHEELVLENLSEVNLTETRGEFTVVVNFGQMTSLEGRGDTISAGQILTEFGEMTERASMTRRKAISALSRKYRLPAREVFSMLESAKSSAV